MKREELRALGLTDEQIEKVMAEHGKSLTEVNAKLSAAEESKKALETQLAARDKDIKELKKGSEDNAELTKKYEELESKYKQEKADYEQQIKDTNLNHAVDLALTGKVHDTNIVRGLLDRTKLTLDDKGTLGGLEEQLKGLQESKSFLFVSEPSPATKQEPSFSGATPSGTGGTTPSSGQAFIDAFTADLPTTK